MSILFTHKQVLFIYFSTAFFFTLYAFNIPINTKVPSHSFLKAAYCSPICINHNLTGPQLVDIEVVSMFCYYPQCYTEKRMCQDMV